MITTVDKRNDKTMKEYEMWGVAAAMLHIFIDEDKKNEITYN